MSIQLGAGGKILLGPAGKVATDPACCCGGVCPAINSISVSTIITGTLYDVDSCPCLATISGTQSKTWTSVDSVPADGQFRITYSEEGPTIEVGGDTGWNFSTGNPAIGCSGAGCGSENWITGLSTQALIDMGGECAVAISGPSVFGDPECDGCANSPINFNGGNDFFENILAALGAHTYTGHFTDDDTGMDYIVTVVVTFA